MNTRREFLQKSGTVAGGAMVAGAMLAQQPGAVGNKEWYDRPMRWMQLAFVEDDPGQYDREILARLLSALPCRCGVYFGGWVRGVLSDEDSATLPQ